MIWNNTEYGFTGYDNNNTVKCNIEQNRIVIYQENDPIEQIEITLESPMPLYDEVQLIGLHEGLEVITIDLSGNYDTDIIQLQKAIETFILENIPV
jgi:hypothetical protein